MANPLDFWKRMLYWLICVEQFSPPCLSAPPFLFLTQTPLILHLLQIPDAHDCLLACHSKCKIMSCQEHKARIHSNSNWLTEHTEPNVDWETRLFQSFLTSTWRLWLFVVAIGLTWDFVISRSKTSVRMSCNIPFQIPEENLWRF